MHKNPKPVVVAKLVATLDTGRKIIVQVHADSTFHNFYHWFTQDGSKRKIPTRTSSRIEGIQPVGAAYRIKAGLHLLFVRLSARKDVREVWIKVSKKKLYRFLTTAAPDKLPDGLPKNSNLNIDEIMARRNGRPLTKLPRVSGEFFFQPRVRSYK